MISAQRCVKCGGYKFAEAEPLDGGYFNQATAGSVESAAPCNCPEEDEVPYSIVFDCPYCKKPIEMSKFQ